MEEKHTTVTRLYYSPASVHQSLEYYTTLLREMMPATAELPSHPKMTHVLTFESAYMLTMWQRQPSPIHCDPMAVIDGTGKPAEIPSPQGRNRAFYMTQVGVAPPSFAVFVKDRRGIPDSFTRYLQNKIRDRFGFEGSPVRVVYRER